MSRRFRLRLVAGAIGLPLLMPAPAPAAPGLRAAEVAVSMTSPTSCEVSMTLDITGGVRVEHHLEIRAGSRIELDEPRGALSVGGIRDVGATRVLVLSPGAGPYRLHYTVEQPATASYRCPLWIPDAPADGRSRDVQLSVRIPAGTRSAGTMPALEWSEGEGRTRLAHLPAFVHVPFGAPGQPPPRDLARTMDETTVLVLIGACAALAWRRGLMGRR